jgi:putative PIN family toxin of toxin-antitoxin system
VRAVLDASVIVAAVWTKNPRSASRVVIEGAAAGAYEPVITDEIEAEYREVLARDKLRRGAPAGAHRIAASIMEALVGVAERVEPAADVHVVEKDSKDDKYVAAAIGGRAGYVVTLDRRHMLALGAYEGVRFVTPGDFLAVLRSSTS